MRVSPDGGTPTTLVDVPAGQFVFSPQLLPGGRSVLFTVAEASAALDFDKAQITVQSLDSGERHVLVKGAGARYVPTGHLLYALGGALWAVPFDIQRQQLTGAPVAVVEGVARGTGVVGTATAQFSVADAGTLVYVPGPPALSSSRRQLVSIDADGDSRPLNVTPGSYASPRIAPGGRSLAVVIDNGKNVDIWIADLTGASSLRRLTFEGRNRFPVWSPDGHRVMFQSDRQGDRAIWWQPADGSGVAERLTKADGGVAHIPEAWIGHTDTVLFSVLSSPEKASLWMLSVVTKQTKPFDAVTSANPLDSSVSPDGRWVAYTLRGSGKAYIYVQPNPPTGAKYEVTDQGHHPLWSPDGGQLQFFPSAGRLVAVKVSTSPSLSFSVAQPVPGGFTSNTSSDSGRNHDVTPQGGIIAALSAAEIAGGISAPTHSEFVLNWLDELKQQVAVK